MRLYALIPAYNPGIVVQEVVAETRKHVDHVVLVDDGCNAENHAFLMALANNHDDVSLLIHENNQGKGFAIHSGLKHILKSNADHVIMLDSDGQHDPQEIERFKEIIRIKDCDFIMGVRQDINKMPLKSKIGNVTMAKLFYLMTRCSVNDTQSGFRLLSKTFMQEFIEACPPGRYETEMKMLYFAAKSHGCVEQVPIKTIYINQNKNSKFRPLQDSFRVIGSFFMYAGVGLLSFCLDYLVYLLAIFSGIHFLNGHLIARACSGVFNYYANKKWVFKNRDSVMLTGSKYVVAVLISLLISSTLLFILVQKMTINAALSKPLAELLTFCINYFIVKHFVFRNKHV